MKRVFEVISGWVMVVMLLAAYLGGWYASTGLLHDCFKAVAMAIVIFCVVWVYLGLWEFAAKRITGKSAEPKKEPEA